MHDVMDWKINDRKRKYKGLVNSHTVLRSNLGDETFFSSCMSSNKPLAGNKRSNSSYQNESFESGVLASSHHVFDLPHPSKMRRRKTSHVKYHEKKTNMIDSYVKQMKLKQARFSWSSLADIRDEFPLAESIECKKIPLEETLYTSESNGDSFYEDTRQSSGLSDELGVESNKCISFIHEPDEPCQIVPTRDNFMMFNNIPSRLMNNESLDYKVQSLKNETIKHHSSTPSILYDRTAVFDDVVAIRTGKGDIMTVLGKTNSTAPDTFDGICKPNNSCLTSNRILQDRNITSSAHQIEMLRRVVNGNESTKRVLKHSKSHVALYHKNDPSNSTLRRHKSFDEKVFYENSFFENTRSLIEKETFKYNKNTLENMEAKDNISSQYHDCKSATETPSIAEIDELDLPEDILALNSIVEYVNEHPEQFKELKHVKRKIFD